jgi:hypothetical protein
MDLAGVPRPIHSDDDLHGLLLGSVQSAFSLDVIESKIPGAGSGIVTSSDIPFGSEIFRAKDALWNVPIILTFRRPVAIVSPTVQAL